MTSAISGPSFSKADVLPALGTLAWSSLPIVGDQLAQRIFYKKTSINQGTDLTLTGLATCIVVVYFLPSGSPARIGAPVLYLAYRTALFYWNRRPKPPTDPTQPALQKPAPKKAAPRTQDRTNSFSRAAPPASAKLPAKKPMLRSHNPQLACSNVSISAALTPAPKPPKETPLPPPSPSHMNPVHPSAAAPIPNIAFTPLSPRGESKEKGPLKTEETKADARAATVKSIPLSDRQKEQLQKANSQAKPLIEKANRLSNEMLQTATSINVKVKITYLPKKGPEAESNEKKSIPKEPEVISTPILINSTCIYKFPKDMIPILQTGMEIKYPITQDTSFCWVYLLFEKTKGSLFPFDYLPTEILRTLTKRNTTLKIETEEKVLEIEFFRAGSQTVGKCLDKLNKCKKIESIQSKFAMIPVNFKDDPVISLHMTALTMDNCYLTPFEKE